MHLSFLHIIMLQDACGLSVHESASACWARILAADNPGYAPDVRRHSRPFWVNLAIYVLTFYLCIFVSY